MTFPTPLRHAALACALAFSHAAFAAPVPTEDPGFTDADFAPTPPAPPPPRTADATLTQNGPLLRPSLTIPKTR